MTVYCEVMGDKTHPEYLKEGGAFFTSFVGEYLAHINDKEMGEYADGTKIAKLRSRKKLPIWKLCLK